MAISPKGTRWKMLWWTLAALAALCAPPAWSYVLMGGQVLERMAEALDMPDALQVVQRLSWETEGVTRDAAAALTETLTYRAPDRFRAEALGPGFRRISVSSGRDAAVVRNGQLQPEPRERFELYKELLLARNAHEWTYTLNMLGIELGVSSLGRFETHYCYVLGAHYPDATVPQLWVDKTSFRPLRLMLPAPSLKPEEGPLEVRYLDWGQVQGAIYPMLIQIYVNHRLWREMRVERLEINPPIAAHLFDTGALRANPGGFRPPDLPPELPPLAPPARPPQ